MIEIYVTFSDGRRMCEEISVDKPYEIRGDEISIEIPERRQAERRAE